jgi:uncharacterized membrane protein YphA (DoxX/SURF4 family)
MRFNKIQTTAYWTTTGLMAVPLIAGGIVDTLAPPDAVAFLAHLGYPAYFATVIGVWKVLGGIAVLAPRLARLKEWAYAGIFFDLTGAAISHAASGDGAGKVSVPLVLAALAVASWMLRPESRKLGSTFAVPAAA